jgi:hypothetical protein
MGIMLADDLVHWTRQRGRPRNWAG